MRPYVITALRNPFLWLVPGVLVPVLVAIGALMFSRQNEVKATIWAQVPALIDTSIGGSSLKPPAEVEAQTFSERLTTESFRSSMITAAGLDERVEAGDWPGKSMTAALLSKLPLIGGSSGNDVEANRDSALAAVESSLRVEAQGNNLVHIIYTGGDAEAGVALVNAAIETFQKENVGQNSTQAQAVLDFYEKQVAERQEQLEEVDTNLRAFEAQYPVAMGASRPASEAQQLGQLQSTYNIRLSQYELALSRQSEAQVRAEASVTTMDNDFRVVDAPRLPSGPSLDIRRAAMLTFMGIVFGGGLAGLLIAVRTWTDNTVHKRDDVEKLLGMDVIASLPLLRKGGKK